MLNSCERLVLGAMFAGVSRSASSFYSGQRTTQGYSISARGIQRIIFSGECYGVRLFLEFA